MRVSITYDAMTTPPRPVLRLSYATLANDNDFDNPTGFQFVQTLATEPAWAHGQGDAIMLANLTGDPPALRGFKYAGYSEVPTGVYGVGDRIVLLRNQTFSNHPDVNTWGFSDWNVAWDELPVLSAFNILVPVTRVWASGGHLTPTYYAYNFLDTPATRNVTALFRKDRATPMLFGRVVPDGGIFGPIFINPYDPNMVIALCTPEPGFPRGVIKVSVDGGASFRNEEALTTILTAGGDRAGDGSLGRYDVEAGNTITHVAFNPFDPAEVAVASKMCGCLFGRITPTSATDWRDLSSITPAEQIYHKTVQLLGDVLYIGYYGGGPVSVSGFRNAPRATVLTAPTSFTIPGTLSVTLKDCLGNGLANLPLRFHIEHVSLTVTGEVRVPYLDQVVQTSAAGEAHVSIAPLLLPGEDYIVRVSFDGTADFGSRDLRMFL